MKTDENSTKMKQKWNNKGMKKVLLVLQVYFWDISQITRFVGDPMSQRNPLFWSSDHHNQPPNLL